MFAPQVTKSRAKDQNHHADIKSTIGSMLPRRSRDIYWRSLSPERSLRPDTSAQNTQIDETLAPMSMPKIAWNFCHIPSYSPERMGSFVPPFPASAPRLPIQTKLRVGADDDPLEHEADGVAEQVMRMPDPHRSIAPVLRQLIRKRAGCEEEENAKMLQPRPAGSAEPAAREAPPIVHEALRAPGQPLDAQTRAYMEPRLGYDFSQVRVHTDKRAAESARAVNSLAYTVGQEVMFREGQYAPHTHHGRKLLAHELAHVVQQAGTGPSLQRFSYAEIKEKAYSGLISGLRTAKKAALDALRGQVGKLPEKWQSAANTIISIVDEVLGVIETLILAVIGLVVGFVEGVVGLVKGLFTLAYGILKLLYDLVVGIFTNFDELKQDLNAIANALKNLPSALKKMVTDWLDRFNKASLERQTLMIAELVGQIEALIASFGVAASRAGSVATVAEAGGEAGAAGTGAAVTEASSIGAQAARPALTVIRGGGGTATTGARAGVPAFEGSGALKIAPVVEEAPAIAPLRVVPPAPAEEVVAAAAPQAAAASARSNALAASAVTAAEAANVGKGKKETPLNTMRFQVQWDTGQGGPTFALPAVAPANPGVTTTEAVAVLWGVVRSVIPAAAQTAAEPAADKQEAWIRSRPPAGVGPGVVKRSEYFPYKRTTDARVDVENLRGQNLKQ